MNTHIQASKNIITTIRDVQGALALAASVLREVQRHQIDVMESEKMRFLLLEMAKDMAQLHILLRALGHSAQNAASTTQDTTLVQ